MSDYRDEFDERIDRADRERGEEFREQERRDRASDYAPAPDEPTDAVLLGALDFLEKTRRDLKAAKA